MKRKRYPHGCADRPLNGNGFRRQFAKYNMQNRYYGKGNYCRKCSGKTFNGLSTGAKKCHHIIYQRNHYLFANPTQTQRGQRNT